MLSLNQPTTGAPRMMNNAGMDSRMNLTKKMTLGSPGRMLMAERIARAKGSFAAFSANTRAICGIAGETSGVASKAIAVAARITNSP